MDFDSAFQFEEDIFGRHTLAGYTFIEIDGLWMIKPGGLYFAGPKGAVAWVEQTYRMLEVAVEEIESERINQLKEKGGSNILLP